MTYPVLIGTINSGDGVGPDPDAEAFITRTNSNGPAISSDEASAIRYLVPALKGANKYANAVAIYPLVGSNAAQKGQNLIAPTFSLGWSFGSWIYNTMGARPPIGGGYGSCSIVPSNHLVLESNAIAAYVNSNNAFTRTYQVPIGCQSTAPGTTGGDRRVYQIVTAPDNPNGNAGLQSQGSITSPNPAGTQTGLWGVSRKGGTKYLARNGQVLAQSTVAADPNDGLPTTQLRFWILGLPPSLGGGSASQWDPSIMEQSIGLFYVSNDGLDDQDWPVINDIFATYCTMLGRAIP